MNTASEQVKANQAGQVSEQVNTFGNLASDLHQVIDAIEACIVGISVSQDPPVPAQGTERQQIVEVAATLRDNNDQVAGAIERIKNLVSRIEL